MSKDKYTHAVIMHPDDIKERNWCLMESEFLKPGEPVLIDLSAIEIAPKNDLVLEGVNMTRPSLADLIYKLRLNRGIR